MEKRNSYKPFNVQKRVYNVKYKKLKIKTSYHMVHCSPSTKESNLAF